jgi:hypothetical protein
MKADDFRIFRPCDGPTTFSCPITRCRGVEIEDGTTLAAAVRLTKQHIRQQHPDGR